MRYLTVASLTTALSIGLVQSSFAADMATKAPPGPVAAPYSWTGWYAGVNIGGGWGNGSLNNSPNDPSSALFLSGFAFGVPPSPARVSQSGVTGGFEAGYNWQVASKWVLGLETDFSGSALNGTNSASTVIPGITQTYTAQQETDWYGTIRGRVGFLTTPNLLLFGTGGFAYGRVNDSASYQFSVTPGNSAAFSIDTGNLALGCAAGPPETTDSTTCFAGNSSTTRVGWTAGGGLEWMLGQYWSAKIEYQHVDLGTDAVRMVNNPPAPAIFVPPGAVLSTFNAVFHDGFNVVRLGLNHRF